MINRLNEAKQIIFTSNSLIFSFLFFNALKLYQISADSKIQLLNLLLSLGIVSLLEDRNKKIKGFKRYKNFKRFFGVSLFIMTLVRSFFLTTYEDKFYYFLLPIGIFSILLFLFEWEDKNLYKNIVIISFLLPLRRVFVFLLDFLLLPVTKYLTWLILFSIGKEPILIGKSIFINKAELIINDACLGADNLFFVACTIYIYLIIFKLRSSKNLKLITLITILVPITINVFRNVLLAITVSIESNYRDDLFNFFHDSYGSLLFSLISVSIVSRVYFSLLNSELRKIK